MCDSIVLETLSNHLILDTWGVVLWRQVQQTNLQVVVVFHERTRISQELFKQLFVKSVKQKFYAIFYI